MVSITLLIVYFKYYNVIHIPPLSLYFGLLSQLNSPSGSQRFPIICLFYQGLL